MQRHKLFGGILAVAFPGFMAAAWPNEGVVTTLAAIVVFILGAALVWGGLD